MLMINNNVELSLLVLLLISTGTNFLSHLLGVTLGISDGDVRVSNFVGT